MSADLLALLLLPGSFGLLFCSMAVVFFGTDAYVRRVHAAHHDEWVSAGCPRGHFWRPPDCPRPIGGTSLGNAIFDRDRMLAGHRTLIRGRSAVLRSDSTLAAWRWCLRIAWVAGFVALPLWVFACVTLG